MTADFASDVDVDRLLRSIGKRCFCNCYETAVRLGEAFDTDDLLRCDPALNGTSPRAMSTRASKIRKLVKEGLAAEALSLCGKGKAARHD